MSKLILSKSGLQEQRENMRLYERVLPSLELKRMQLTAELKRAQEHLIHSKTDAERFRAGALRTSCHSSLPDSSAFGLGMRANSL